MTSEQNNIPKGWIKTNLENISTIILGQSPPSSTYNKEKKGLPFFQGKAEFGQLYPTARIWCDSPKKTAEKDDILISVRAPVGSTNISASTCCIGRGLSAIRVSDAADMMYVFYQLRHLENHIAQKGTGTTFKAITGKQLSSIQISLPPLNEQRRIVSKLESIFAQIDAAREKLLRLQDKARSGRESMVDLKRSVLKQAFEGRLVPQNPNDKSINTLLQKTHNNSKNESIFEKGNLPKGWAEIILDDYVSIAGRIGWRGLKRSEYTNSGPFLLAVKDIDECGRINYDKVTEHLSEFRYEESPEIKLQNKDILITKDGTIGKVGYVDKVLSPTTVNSSILVVRPTKPIFPKYLFYYFRSPFFQQIVNEKIKGIAIPHLFQYDIKKFHLRICPFNEQKRIVTKLESIFGRIDAVEKSVAETLTKMELFKKSVLKHAFEGRLVPQDPNDEPASVLLERIKAEKTIYEDKKPVKRRTRNGK